MSVDTRPGSQTYFYLLVPCYSEVVRSRISYENANDRLHWLPVPMRFEFKICLLTFKTLHSMAPHYITDLCRSTSVAESGQDLGSVGQGDIHV